MNRLNCITIFLLAVAACASHARAAEVHTNGTGGGPWSDPATWRKNAVPTAQDSAVISTGDAVVFDRADDKPACKDLYIDAEGSLTFKPGAKRLLSLAGPIESYGLIRLDASESDDDSIEIRLTSGDPMLRTLKLAKGGSLLCIGRKGLAEGKRNVLIRSDPPAPATPVPLTPVERRGVVEAVAGTSLDLRFARLDFIALRAGKIDNTGAKPNERLSVTDCMFTSGSTVELGYCDTPALLNNTFGFDGPPLPGNALTVSYCPLAEVRGNKITGGYAYGIFGYQQTDSSVSDNSIAKCINGIYWVGVNDMLKNNAVRDCNIGTIATSMSGAIEDLSIDNCIESVSVTNSNVQATNVRIGNVPKDGVRLHLVSGAITLVNCDLTPEQIKQEPNITVMPTPRVQSMSYLVVGVTGAIPPGGAVNVVTANPPKPIPKGAPDLNVRNAPALLGGPGITPLPQSLKPLIVRGWVIEGDAKVTPAPQYNVTVTGKPDKPDGEPKPVKTVTVTPDAKWYRVKPNEPTPTLEITIP